MLGGPLLWRQRQMDTRTCTTSGIRVGLVTATCSPCVASTHSEGLIKGLPLGAAEFLVADQDQRRGDTTGPESVGNEQDPQRFAPLVAVGHRQQRPGRVHRVRE